MPGWLASIPVYELAFYAWLAWAITAVVGILTARRSPVATLAWMLALLLMPVVGVIAYIAFGPRRLTRRRLRYLAASDAVVKAAISRLHATRSDARFTAETSRLQLALTMEQLGEGLPTRATGVTAYRDGDACYAAIERAIREAAHHVHVEYYIWEDDPVGRRLRDLLAERAKAGVRVRVLVDGVGSGILGARFWRPLVAAGGSIAWFNAFRWRGWRPHLFNFRTHRKIVICDGRVGFTGGVNVSARHSAEHAGSAAWRDTHVEIRGEPVRKLQRIFLEDWFFAAPGETLADVDVGQLFPAMTSQTGPWTHVVASGPDNDAAAIHRFYFGAINAARRRIWLTTPYFVPDDPILEALASAALRGVDVQLLVPRSGDSRIVAAASRTYHDQVAAYGVRVHRYLPAMLHAKTMVIDDDLAIIGTANIDNRSFRLNFEVIAAFFDELVTAELATQFSEDLATSQPYRKLSRRRLRRLSTLYDRFLDSLARLGSPVL